MEFRLPYEKRARIDADVVARSAHVAGDVEPTKSSGRRKRHHRWKHPITDGPFAESKEMFGGCSFPPTLATDDG